MPKMPKSHDQPLCAYLMRYAAHIQSHPRSLPKWYITEKNWNPMKRIQVIIRTPTADRQTDGRTDRWTDGQMDRVNPVYHPQLRCKGYKNCSRMQYCYSPLGTKCHRGCHGTKCHKHHWIHWACMKVDIGRVRQGNWGRRALGSTETGRGIKVCKDCWRTKGCRMCRRINGFWSIRGCQERRRTTRCQRINDTEGAGKPMVVGALRAVRSAHETRAAEEPGSGEGAGETSAAEPRAARCAEEPMDAWALRAVRNAW